MVVSFIIWTVGIGISIIILIPLVIVFKNGFVHKKCESKRKLIGKTALITGSSSGIGLETARDFASRGARIVLACRSMERAKKAAEDIKRTTKNHKIAIYQLDTSSLASVRNCAKEVLKNEDRIDILVNNAGSGGTPKQVITDDGFDLVMATNYYGHFLLTNLLLGLIVKSAPSRIVNVSSELYAMCFSLDPENLIFKNKYYNLFSSYSQSKMAMNLFSNELARKLSKKGVTVNCLHPGFVATEIFKKSRSWVTKYMEFISVIGARSVVSGAQTTIHVAVSEETENITGQFFDDCKVSSLRQMAKDKDLATRLWEASVRDVKLKPSEIHY